MPKKERKLLEQAGFEFWMQKEQGKNNRGDIDVSSDSSSSKGEERPSLGESTGSESGNEESSIESIPSSSSTCKLPANKHQEMEQYLEFVQAQIRDIRRELNELE
eukprot:scaffold3742_cov118-Cylindrotheca_fusiformis.AAC.2